MIYGLVLVLHVLVSLVLIAVILLQGGRGGLSEALGGAAAQSLFGSGATTVLTRITAMCAGLFVVTCLSLAYLSTLRGRSIIDQIPTVSPEQIPSALPVLPAESGLPSRPSPPAAPPAATRPPAEPVSTAPAQSP